MGWTCIFLHHISEIRFHIYVLASVRRVNGPRLLSSIQLYKQFTFLRLRVNSELRSEAITPPDCLL